MLARVDLVRVARDFVGERFPDALTAFLGGSAGTGLRTPTSDLDVVVVRGGDATVFRETTTYRGWPVEAFCHTVESLTAFVEKETAARRSSLLHMCAEGVLLLEREGLGRRLQAEALARLEAGPPPLSAEELEDHRYRLTDLLDDLAGASDPDEQVFIASRLLGAVGELVLALRGEWQASGKWLFRRLRAADEETCSRLLLGYRQVAGRGDAMPLCLAVEAVLERAGGRLLEGYLRVAPDGLPRS